jgi:chromosome partitioning protein
MQIIVINSQKGGSGKSMLAKHLAVEAERAGDGPVYLIDADPQGTLTAWHAKREAETPALVDLPFDGLAKGLKAIDGRGGTYVLIDTASGRLDVAADLFKIADLVIFPVQASEDDLTAAPTTVRNLKAAKAAFVFVLTVRSPRRSSPTGPATGRPTRLARPSSRPSRRARRPQRLRRCGATSKHACMKT